MVDEVGAGEDFLGAQRRELPDPLHHRTARSWRAPRIRLANTPVNTPCSIGPHTVNAATGSMAAFARSGREPEARGPHEAERNVDLDFPATVRQTRRSCATLHDRPTARKNRGALGFIGDGMARHLLDAGDVLA